MSSFPARPTYRGARSRTRLPGACADAKQVFDAAREALAGVLGDRPFALYRRADGVYLPEGRGLDQAPAFPASSSLVNVLRQVGRPVMATGTHGALALRARLDPADVAVLDRLHAVALVPMTGDDALLGFLCLSRVGRPTLGSIACAVTALLAAAEARLLEVPIARRAPTPGGCGPALRVAAAVP